MGFGLTGGNGQGEKSVAIAGLSLRVRFNVKLYCLWLSVNTLPRSLLSQHQHPYPHYNLGDLWVRTSTCRRYDSRAPRESWRGERWLRLRRWSYGRYPNCQ